MDTQVQAEWLILADGAQVVGNKLYLLGGGWDVLTVNTGFPIRQHVALAASFAIPWSETNHPHDAEIELQDEDGKIILSLQGQIELGRPPGIPAGTMQRAQIAADASLELERPGTYVVLARVNGEESKRITFTVVPGPVLQQRARFQSDAPGGAS